MWKAQEPINHKLYFWWKHAVCTEAEVKKNHEIPFLPANGSGFRLPRESPLQEAVPCTHLKRPLMGM